MAAFEIEDELQEGGRRKETDEEEEFNIKGETLPIMKDEMQ